MTEKRFRVHPESNQWIWDTEAKTKKHRVYSSIDAKELIDLLNELYEKNQLLHKTIEELDNCQKGQSHRINDLYLENKQLKDLISHLGYTIKYDGYRHISLELKR